MRQKDDSSDPAMPRDAHAADGASPPAPRRGLSVHPIAWLFFVVFVVAGAVAAFARPGDAGALVFAGIIMAVGIVSLVVLVLTWIVWLLSGRSRLAATLVMSLLFALAALGQFGAALQADRSARAMEQIHDDQADWLKRVEAYLTTEDLVMDGAPMLRSMAERLTQAARDLPPREAELMRILAAIHLDMAALVEEYEAAVEIYAAAGANDAATIATREQLAERIEMVRTLADVNDRFLAFCASLEADLGRRLDNTRLSAEQRRQFIRSFARSANMDMVVGIRETDTQILDASLGMLAVLDQSWGTWEVDLQTGEVLFEDDASIRKFNHHFDVLDAAADRQLELQQQLLDRLRARGSTRR